MLGEGLAGDGGGERASLSDVFRCLVVLVTGAWFLTSSQLQLSKDEEEDCISSQSSQTVPEWLRQEALMLLSKDDASCVNL